MSWADRTSFRMSLNPPNIQIATRSTNFCPDQFEPEHGQIGRTTYIDLRPISGRAYIYNTVHVRPISGRSNYIARAEYAGYTFRTRASQKHLKHDNSHFRYDYNEDLRGGRKEARKAFVSIIRIFVHSMYPGGPS